jgi:hypothetical protein
LELELELELGIPTANQGFGNVPLAALRIKSMGLVQEAGGSGERVSLIWKSPVGESKTPAKLEVCSVKGTVGSQIRVAITCRAAVPDGARPALSPPPRINPFPLTVMLPFEFTVAAKLLIFQICPGGCTPRTILKVGVTVQGEVVPQPVMLETGSTPIPPLKYNGYNDVCAAAGSDQTTPSNIVHAKPFFMIPPL